MPEPATLSFLPSAPAFSAESTYSVSSIPCRRPTFRTRRNKAKREDSPHHTHRSRLSSPLRANIPALLFPVLNASISAESESLQVVAHRENLPPEAMMEVLASEAEAAIKATTYLRRSVHDS